MADVCSKYIEHSQKRVTLGALNAEYGKAIGHYLNELCVYCGALPVTELKKGHIKYWVESHQQWGPVTRRNVVTIVLGAFNYAQRELRRPESVKGTEEAISSAAAAVVF